MKSREQVCQSLAVQHPWPACWWRVYSGTHPDCARAHCITTSSVYIAYTYTVLLEYTKLQLCCLDCYCYLHALSRCMQYGNAFAQGSCHHWGISTLVLLIVNVIHTVMNVIADNFITHPVACGYWHAQCLSSLCICTCEVCSLYWPLVRTVHPRLSNLDYPNPFLSQLLQIFMTFIIIYKMVAIL